MDSLPVELYEKIPYSLMSQTLQTLLKDPIAAEKALAQGTEKWQISTGVTSKSSELVVAASDESNKHP